MSGNSVDNRVVAMKFDNAEFEKGVSTTMGTLDKLKASLKFKGADKGINDLQKGVNAFSMAPIEGGITHVSKSFLALSTVAITTLAQITSRAVTAGIQITKSFTTAPIKQGLQEYETTLNSIQTILANTGLKGDAGLTEVNSALSDLNHYSDLTIYNFSEMAKNIGTFTAAGIKLKPATEAIKGIANLAAVSGSSADQASTAMYQMSQALASGSVKLQDWNSVVNAGMGGKVFQESLKETARNHGVAVDAIIKKEGSFRESLKSGWLSSGILTETLQKFTGDLTASQLKQMGYTDQEIKGILEMGKTAQDAATKVKTVSQLINTLQEAAGSGWAQTWQLIFGNFNEAKTLFTNVNNVLSGMINSSSKARNKVLGDWNKLGGRTILIMAISQAFKDLIRVLKPVRDAFHNIFPKKTGQDLVSMTMGFYNFTRAMVPSRKTLLQLQVTFRGFFAIFDIARQVIKGVAKFFFDLAKSAGVGGGGFLDFTAKVGGLIYGFDQMLKKGDVINKFFDGLAEKVKPVIAFFQSAASYLGSIFDHFDPKPLTVADQALGRVSDRLHTFSGLGGLIAKAWSGIIKLFSQLGTLVEPAIQGIADAFSGLGDAIAASIQNGNFNAVLDLINTTLLGGIVLLIQRFFHKGIKVNLGGGLVKQMEKTFGLLTNQLKVMQQDVKANILLKIAGAIALITASVVALSLIDSDKLTKAMTALAVGFAQLLGAMAVLTQITTSAGFIKIPVIATSLILLSTAILILTGAIKVLSTMNWEELAKGLSGLAGLLLLLSVAVKPISANAAGMITAGVGLAALSVGLLILTAAVKAFSLFSWKDMAKGLVGVAASLVVVGLAMQTMPITLPITGAGLILVAAGLTALAGAMKLMSQFSWKEMGKGLAGIGGALVIIAAAMNLMPVTLPIMAAGLILVGIALTEIAGVAKIFATMSWQEMAKAAAGLAGALLIIAGGLYLMEGALPGAAALLVASAALVVLSKALSTIGDMSWGDIAKGLVGLAAALVIIGLAAIGASFIMPALLGLGAALVILGAGLALAGAGAFLFATAFATVAAVGTAGIAVLTGMLSAIISAIPGALQAFGLGIVAFAEVIGSAGPALLKAIGAVINALLDALIQAIPRLGHFIDLLLGTLLGLIVKYIPKLYNAGLKIIIGILSGIRDNIEKIVTVAVQIITNFLRAIGKQAPKIADAAAKMIIDFINGISDAIDDNSEALGQAGGRLAVSIITGIVKGLAGGLKQITDAAGNLGHSAVDAAKKALHINSPSKDFIKIGQSINEGFIKGLVGGRASVKNALDDMRQTLRDAIGTSAQDIKDQQDKIKSLQAAGKSDSPAMRKAKQSLAEAEKLHKGAIAANELLTHGLQKQRTELKTLGHQYDLTTAKLEKANQKLTDAKKAYKDNQTSVTQTFSQTPDISNTTNLASYEAKIKKQTEDTIKFRDSLKQLKKMGLDDATYNKLLAEGVSIQPFVDKLLQSGPNGIKQLNNLDKGLSNAAKSLGTQTSKDLYQAGVDSAQGLVDGLKHSQKKIENQMAAIGRAMARAIKKELGIKSPSKEGIEIGKFMVAGISKGLDTSADDVETSAQAVADRALKAMKATMANIHEHIGDNLNLQPTIKPVLDLTQVTKESAKLDKLKLNKNLDVRISAEQAAKIAKLRESASGAKDAATTFTPDVRDIKLTQINQSPKALSRVEIYRDTKSLISLAKEALKT